MSDEDIERFGDDLEMQLWQEYRAVSSMFAYAVETERRFYLANQVKVKEHETTAVPWFEVELTDAWVWDMYRPNRFVTNVRIVSRMDVNIEELARKDFAASDAIAPRDPDPPTP
jgi:Protein of unknown function (DUF2469)